VSARTLTEVAELMGLAKVMKEPERFLTRQIKAGKIRARKFGRHWLMTDADVEFALEQFANTVEEDLAPEAQAAPAGVSAGSARRRLAVAR
jgi:excisionase family DNA binding protein